MKQNPSRARAALLICASRGLDACESRADARTMWRHPKFGLAFSNSGVIAAGTHLGLKTWTFPVPPSEAGLIDAGPLLSAWFTLVLIQTFRHLKWFDQSETAGVFPST